MNILSKTIIIASTVTGLTVPSIAFAQDQTQDMQEMMQDGDMKMMPMMGMMTQMNEMMGNCNKMMQAMMSDMPANEDDNLDNKG